MPSWLCRESNRTLTTCSLLLAKGFPPLFTLCSVLPRPSQRVSLLSGETDMMANSPGLAFM